MDWLGYRHTEIAELPCMESLNNSLDRNSGEFIYHKRFSIRITNREEWMDGTGADLYKILVFVWVQAGWEHLFDSVGQQRKGTGQLRRTPSNGVSIGRTGYEDVRGEDAL